MVSNIELECASDTIKDGLDGIEKLTADWKAIGLLGTDSTIKEQLVVDPSVPLEESIIDVRYSCGATARVQLNNLNGSQLVRARRLFASKPNNDG